MGRKNPKDKNGKVISIIINIIFFTLIFIVASFLSNIIFYTKDMVIVAILCLVPAFFIRALYKQVDSIKSKYFKIDRNYRIINRKVRISMFIVGICLFTFGLFKSHVYISNIENKTFQVSKEAYPIYYISDLYVDKKGNYCINNDTYGLFQLFDKEGNFIMRVDYNTNYFSGYDVKDKIIYFYFSEDVDKNLNKKYTVVKKSNEKKEYFVYGVDIDSKDIISNEIKLLKQEDIRNDKFESDDIEYYYEGVNSIIKVYENQEDIIEFNAPTTPAGLDIYAFIGTVGWFMLSIGFVFFGFKLLIV